MFFRELEYMSVSMDGVLTLLSVTLLCFYYSLIVALVSVPVLSKFLSVCIWWVLLDRYFPVELPSKWVLKICTQFLGIVILQIS
jgi:hypothetical protein